jgi:alcohol dehydrogenase
MRQLTFLGPGKLEWREVPDPTIETPLDAIIRPFSVATCDLDGAVIRGGAPLPGPYPFGHEAVAQVIETGAGVTTVKRGDQVICPFQISCGQCQRCLRGLTGSCEGTAFRSAYGLGPIGGLQWGSALSGYMRVPFADAMLVKVAPGSGPLASCADNVPDGWRTVAPHLEKNPGAPVLIIGGAGPGSIPLYAVAVARALGSDVRYVDFDARRLEIATGLGAQAEQITEGKYPQNFGKYPVTVDGSANADGLACAVRSVEPWGVCTSTGIYFAPTPMPLFEMYSIGVTFITGRVNARAALPSVLKLVGEGKLQPEKVTTETAGWDDAIEALLGYTTKLVITRAPEAL